MRWDSVRSDGVRCDSVRLQIRLLADQYWGLGRLPMGWMKRMESEGVWCDSVIV